MDTGRTQEDRTGHRIQEDTGRTQGGHNSIQKNSGGQSRAHEDKAAHIVLKQDMRTHEDARGNDRTHEDTREHTMIQEARKIQTQKDNLYFKDTGCHRKTPNNQ